MNLFRGIFKKNKTILENCNPDDIPVFSFDNIKTKCKIDYFYDGDSCTIIIEYNKTLIKLKCRLIGIDTPELRSNNMIEKMAAKRVRDYVSQYENQILTVHLLENDKYGRTLVELFDENGTSINQHLIDIGMAYAYDGKTKTDFFTWYKIR